MTAAASRQRPEFSRVLLLEEVPEDGYRAHLEADAAERTALAVRFGLPSIAMLQAEIEAHWLDRGRVLRVSGRLRARAQQTCVVTLEPVDEVLDEEIDILFGREAGRVAPGAEIEIDPDDTEPLEGDAIDLGEIVATEFALSLDPYPRHPDIAAAARNLGPGATLTDDESPSSGESGPRNRPFEILAGLKPKL